LARSSGIKQVGQWCRTSLDMISEQLLGAMASVREGYQEHFTRVFRRVVGMTPQDWRQSQQVKSGSAAEEGPLERSLPLPD
jgi:methylphosphotriester-DNA--protein-cysteine methyltransferase